MVTFLYKHGDILLTVILILVVRYKDEQRPLPHFPLRRFSKQPKSCTLYWKCEVWSLRVTGTKPSLYTRGFHPDWPRLMDQSTRMLIGVAFGRNKEMLILVSLQAPTLPPFLLGVFQFAASLCCAEIICPISPQDFQPHGLLLKGLGILLRKTHWGGDKGQRSARRWSGHTTLLGKSYFGWKTPSTHAPPRRHPAPFLILPDTRCYTAAPHKKTRTEVISFEHPRFHLALKPGVTHHQYSDLSFIIYAQPCQLTTGSRENAVHLVEFNGKCLRSTNSLNTRWGTTRPRGRMKPPEKTKQIKQLHKRRSI